MNFRLFGIELMSFFSGTIFTEKLRNIIDINLENDEK